MNIKVDISVGELVDKITILEIKLQRIDNLNKKKFIEKELQVLNEVYTRIADLNSETLKTKLLYINNKLWDIEDNIRVKDSKNEFDDEFIKLAKSVYVTNDERFKLKNEINLLYNSFIQEQKSYKF